MTNDADIQARQTLSALLVPLARLMLDNAIALPDAVELLKSAMLSAALDKEPDAPASKLSLMTGVHRKDIKRLEIDPSPAGKGGAAARVLSLWQNDPEFCENGAPRALSPKDPNGFDELVRRAKVDAAPATMLSLLLESGNVRESDGAVHFVSASLVPRDHSDKLRAAESTLVPHLATAVSNLSGARGQWDQALRYSHLSEDAARQLEQEAARLALEMLRTLDAMAHALQQKEEGDRLFVAGTFTHIAEPDT